MGVSTFTKKVLWHDPKRLTADGVAALAPPPVLARGEGRGYNLPTSSPQAGPGTVLWAGPVT